MWESDRATQSALDKVKFIKPRFSADQRTPCCQISTSRKTDGMSKMKIFGYAFLFLYLARWNISVIAGESKLTSGELKMISELVNSPSVVQLNQEVLSLSEDIYLLDSLNSEIARSVTAKKDNVKTASIQLIRALELADSEEKSILLELGRLSREIKDLNNKLLTQKKTLLDYQSELRVKSRLLVVQNDYLRKKKIALRNDILSRLKAESSGEDSLIYQGDFLCSPQKNINQCLGAEGRRAEIIAQASANIDDAWSIKDISHYKITDATMNLNGEVRYSVNIKFKKSFNNNMIAYINDLLGLSQFLVTLHSNKNAEYFIDGKSYGVGKTKQVTLDVGTHSFYVKNDHGSSSIIRSINNDVNFFMPISDGDFVGKKTYTPPKALIKSPKSRYLSSHAFTVSDVTFSVPIANKIDDKDTYSDQGNLFKRLSFNDGVDFCEHQGLRVASQLEYTKILKSQDFQNQVGLKSSYWLNQDLVLSRMGDGVLAKRVNSMDKYSILCVK